MEILDALPYLGLETETPFKRTWTKRLSSPRFIQNGSEKSAPNKGSEAVSLVARRDVGVHLRLS